MRSVKHRIRSEGMQKQTDRKQAPTPQHPLFIEAIEKKMRLACVYHGKPRVIEPQCYGVGHPGRELVRVHQIRGGSQAEPLFYAAEIEDVRPIDTFTKPGPNYRRNDSAMAVIFAQL
jgi:hypothetical protein